MHDTLAVICKGTLAPTPLADGFDMLGEDRVAIACALGGPERRTLFLLSSTDAYPKRRVGTRPARLEAVRVDILGAGLP